MINKENNPKKLTVCYFGFYEPDFSRNQVYIDGLKKNGVEVVECNDFSKSKFLKYRNLYREHWKIRKKYDLMIVSHIWRTTNLSDHFAVPFAKLISRKKIIHNAMCSNYEAAILCREVAKQGSFRAKLYWMADYLACHYASLILVETEEQKKFYIKNFKINEKKCIRMWTGANDKDFFIEPVNKNEKFTVVLRGGLLPETGIEYVLKAAKKLEDEGVNFLILGWAKTEKIEKNIEEIMRNKGPKNLKFITEYLPLENLRKTMLSHHASLGQFGNHERIERTIPHRAFESLALGLPYITAEAAGVKELLTNRVNCLFVKRANPNDLAEKILELRDSPELRKKIAENGYKLYKEKLTPKVLGEELLSICHRLIKN
ncbi:MAG: hypothetical protein A2V69_01460 [Candidatus Portnoybacteria bacterium RBG_13_40_8]|uniref:Glycosyl transferase family 1 domain-containing protein n=1 Tax=Candidatus Portnoybacteria bacterium RBG_13_40_8 TaxID=1801990 RepID=A0A1G2F6G7_9BACT|nr:MAG: hypothetical protein A2V69_01460 [Candidatus Portnoybacteria bacterium RBG_13_40_8]